jgi:hypothetical protein
MLNSDKREGSMSMDHLDHSGQHRVCDKKNRP